MLVYQRVPFKWMIFIGTTNSDQLMCFFLDGSEFRIRTGLTLRDCLWHFKKYVSVYPNGDLLWISLVYHINSNILWDPLANKM